jgi:methylthioribose-1-phosphate isomerase
MRTVEWDLQKNELNTVDQRLLPARFERVILRDYQSVAEAIRNMTIRGAPAIGAAAGYGMALAACYAKATTLDGLRAELRAAGKTLVDARPTAVNLPWAVERMLKVVEAEASSAAELRDRLVAEAIAIADEDVAMTEKICEYGAALIKDGDTIIHHCNTGALAVVDLGTALGVIHKAHLQGKHITVLVDETRPRLQGARLTAWELQQWGVPYYLISDNMAGHFLHTGQVQKVFFGADRVTANGDVANKIGSYMLALAAHANNVPVYSVFPTSTVDMRLASGSQIPIEERDQDEVLGIKFHDEQVVPTGARARNPAFDVTPHHLLTGLITEKGVIYPPFRENLPRIMAAKED